MVNIINIPVENIRRSCVPQDLVNTLRQKKHRPIKEKPSTHDPSTYVNKTFLNIEVLKNGSNKYTLHYFNKSQY